MTAAPAAATDDHPAPPAGKTWPAWQSRLALALPAMAAIWACRHTLGFGLLADARFLIAENRHLRGWGDLWANLSHDYFWSSSGNSIPYWRPLTKASWLAETITGGGAPWVYHAVQGAWFAVACAGVAALALRLGAWPIWAGVFGCTAALHPAVAEPVGLIMARSDVVAAACGLWSAVAWLRWQSGDGRGLWWHLALLAAALGSKEGAVLMPLALVALAWPGQFGRPDWRALGRSVLPAALAVALYLILRRAALGSRPAAEIAADPLRWFAGLGAYAVALFPGQLFHPAVANLPRAQAAELGPCALAVGAIGAWVAWLGWAWRRGWPDAGLIAWMALTLLPVLTVAELNVPGVAGKIALADRWMLPAMLVSQAAFALAVSRSRHRGLHRGALVLALGWLSVRAALVGDDLANYADEAAMVGLEERQYLATPPAYLTAEDRCRHATRLLVRQGQAGDFGGVLQLADRHQADCAGNAEFAFNRFVARVQHGDYAAAVSEGRALLANPPADRRYAATIQLLFGKALARTGQGRQALPHLQQAAQLGAQSCETAQLLGEATAADGRHADAARWHRTAARCLVAAGLDATGQWSAAARQWTEAGDTAKAHKDLQRAGLAELPGAATATEH